MILEQLVRVDVTTNGGWFNAAQGSRPFSDMKHTLHRVRHAATCIANTRAKMQPCVRACTA